MIFTHIFMLFCNTKYFPSSTTCEILQPRAKHQVLDCSQSFRADDASAMCDIQKNTICLKMPENTEATGTKNADKAACELTETTQTHDRATLADVKCNIPGLFLSWLEAALFLSVPLRSLLQRESLVSSPKKSLSFPSVSYLTGPRKLPCLCSQTLAGAGDITHM